MGGRNVPDADRATVIKASRYARRRVTDMQRLFRHRHVSDGLPNNKQGRKCVEVFVSCMLDVAALEQLAVYQSTHCSGWHDYLTTVRASSPMSRA
jgi:hypothetical protein